MSPVGALIRIATCISGRVEAVVNCGPLFSYGSVGGTWSYSGEGYDAMTITAAEGDTQLTLAGSALTLKGLSYAPTGAIMAAATTSLPETPGGARNCQGADGRRSRVHASELVRGEATGGNRDREPQRR